MMHRIRRLAGLALVTALVAGFSIIIAGGRQTRPAAGEPAADRLGRLDVAVRQAEGIRAAKRLQYAYAHYVELGLWHDAADLFTDKGTAYFGTTPVTGREQIRARMLADNAGRLGLGEGRLNSRLLMEPVVTFDPDGMVIRGRWHVFGMVGQHGVSAAYEGGVFENEYVEENGVWKIRTLREYPMFTGKYEDNGWVETPEGAPFHYDVNRAGTPVPLVAGSAGGAASATSGAVSAKIADLQRRVDRLNDEAAVSSLQHSYGYYVDRKMWDDVADLFASDATMELDARGVYVGAKSIRRALEQFGPQGLKDGEINDHLQLQTFVTVDSAGQTAWARGFELRTLGVNQQYAEWGQGIFENEYRKENGVWKIRAMRVYPRMVADYEKSWKAAKAVAGASLAYPPDKPPSLKYTVFPQVQWVPFHFVHPVTGKAVQYPAGVSVPGRPVTVTVKGTAAPQTAALDGVERGLARAIAYDGTENVANAYGYYIDGFLWDDMANLFSKDGWKELSYIGTYVGRERVRDSVKMRYGNRNGRTRGSGGFAMHQKTQPVITVSADGQSARIRTRLFQLGGNTWLTGIYENAAVKEDGIWKISAMDLDYVWTAQYRAGWAKVADSDNRRFAPTTPPALPPDRPLRGAVNPPFPKIADMGFHYRNPVSGREPKVLLTH